MAEELSAMTDKMTLSWELPGPSVSVGLLLQAVATVATALRSQRIVSASKYEQIRIQAQLARIQCANTAVGTLISDNIDRIATFSAKIQQLETNGVLDAEGKRLAGEQLNLLGETLSQSVIVFRKRCY